MFHMKKYLYLIAAAVLFVQSYCLGYTVFETFDSGASGWSASGFGDSTVELVNDGVGRHLRVKIVRDEDVGRFVMPLAQPLSIGSNYDDKIYIQFDVQVVGGFGNFGSSYVGAGSSADDNFTNLSTVRLYWNGDAGEDMYRFYGSIHDAGGIQRSYTAYTSGRAGYAYRVKAEYGTVYVDDGVNQGPRLYYDVSVSWINADGSTGKFLNRGISTQTFTNPATTALLTVDQLGIFNSNTLTSGYRYLTYDLDNVYISNEGPADNSVLPSWYNLEASDTDMLERFDTEPSEWTEDRTENSLNEFNWIGRAGDGYMGVQLVRPVDPVEYASFYKEIGKTFIIDNSDFAEEEYGIGWFVEFDAHLVNIGHFSEGFIGTGSAEYGQVYLDQNIAGGFYYGAQELGDGIRIGVGGYGNNYPTSRDTEYIRGGLVENTDYRFRYAACQREKRTRLQADIYEINPDGSTGSTVGSGAMTLGSAGESLYADVIGFFSSLQSSSLNRTEYILVDNLHFSDVGFLLDGIKPTWNEAPLCQELAEPMPGDVGSAAGVGVYDCVVDLIDLQLLAQDWLRVGN
jgi:hypothetical protein